MMKEIMDELIAKYLSGNATEEEESIVLDYMAENEEHLDDLLTSVDALREQHKYDMAAKRRPMAIYSAAASVVLLMVVGGIWLLKGGSVTEGGEKTAWINPQMVPLQQKEQYGDPDIDEPECYIIQERPASDRKKNHLAARRNTPVVKMYDTIYHAFTYFGNLREAPVVELQDTMEDKWKEVMPFSSDEVFFPEEKSTEHPVYMVASIRSEAKSTEKNASVFLKCNIPEKWLENDSLRISWETNASGVKIEIISANDYVYTETVDDGRTSVVYSMKMREQFVKDGKFIVCYLTALPAVEGAPQMSNIIHLVEKK